MTTTANTWFYNPPEKNAFLIAERLRTSLWDGRLGSIWLDTVRAESPILMRGNFKGALIELEWEPKQWCILRTNPAAEDVLVVIKNILGFAPSFKYETPAGFIGWEWRLGNTKERWQAIQGQPEFGKLEMLK